MRGKRAKKLRKLASSKGRVTKALIIPHEKWVPGEDDKDGNPTEIRITSGTLFYHGYRRVYQNLKRV